MNRFIQLFRVGNCLMGVAGLLLGALIATGTSILDHYLSLIFASIVVFTFVAAGNSLNDYTDREVDRKAHPERPIPSGRLAPRTALALAGVLFAASFLVSLSLDPISIIIVVSAIAVMIIYEAWSKRQADNRVSERGPK